MAELKVEVVFLFAFLFLKTISVEAQHGWSAFFVNLYVHLQMITCKDKDRI